MSADDLIEFEKKIADLWEAGKINAPIHLSGGNESQLIEIFKEIKKEDYVFSSHRNHYHALLHGVDDKTLMDEILGKPEGRCRGRARSMGFIDTSRNFYSSAIVGGCCAIAVGVAWSLKQQLDNDPLSIDENAKKRHVWCFIGDSVLDGGHFWEALQYAEGYNLPLTFILEDNNRATCTETKYRCGLNLGLREIIKGHPNVRWYPYEATHKHVGTTKYVQF